MTDYGKNNDLSSICKYEAYCLERKKIHLYFAKYHEPMGKGRMVSEDDWEKNSHPKSNSEG